MGSETICSPPPSGETWDGLFRTASFASLFLFLENFLGCMSDFCCWTSGSVSADFILSRCLCLRLKNLKVRSEEQIRLQASLTFLLSEREYCNTQKPLLKKRSEDHTEFHLKGCLFSALLLAISSSLIQIPILKTQNKRNRYHTYSYNQNPIKLVSST